MLEIEGRNLWDFWNDGEWIGVTTNGFVKVSGAAVMGRGIAREAAKRFPDLALILGKDILDFGNIPFVYKGYRLITIPVKHHWYEKADIDLIKQSCYSLVDIVYNEHIEKLFIPRPGCGNGNLLWSNVKPEIEMILDDRFVAVTF